MPRPVWLLALALLLAAPAGARAQEDILTQARSAPTRSESLRILEQHLALHPADVDARLLYGLVLSWERRYDEARRELQHVLTAAAEYLDARVALMNVEWWSGRLHEARALSDAILRREPGNAQARLVRQRIDAANRKWTAGLVTSVDVFSDDRAPWQEQLLSLGRQTAAGPVTLRLGRADRFGADDHQIEVEFYPVFRAGTYAFIGAGVSDREDALYPGNRLSLEIYQSAGRGFEISAGYRRLAFSRTVHLVSGSLTKYVGTWMVTARVARGAARDNDDDLSGHVQARRYFGATGTSFAGLGYGRGRAAENIRGTGDFAPDITDGVKAELDVEATPRLRLQTAARTERERRTAAGALWRTTLSGGLSVRF